MTVNLAILVRCGHCRRLETDCAYLVLDGGCCERCTHWTAYDAFGNIRYTVRSLPIEHGTEQGYRAHLRNRTQRCDPCRRAHARHNDAYRYARTG